MTMPVHQAVSHLAAEQEAIERTRAQQLTAVNGHRLDRDQLLDVLAFTAAEDLEQRCEAVGDRSLVPAHMARLRHRFIAEQSVEVMAALVNRHEKALSS